MIYGEKMTKPIVNTVTERRDPDYHLVKFQVSSSIISVDYNQYGHAFIISIDIFPILYYNADFIEDPTRTKPVDPTGKI